MLGQLPMGIGLHRPLLLAERQEEPRLVVEWHLHQVQGTVEHQKVPLRTAVAGRVPGRVGVTRYRFSWCVSCRVAADHEGRSPPMMCRD